METRYQRESKSSEATKFYMELYSQVAEASDEQSGMEEKGSNPTGNEILLLFLEHELKTVFKPLNIGKALSPDGLEKLLTQLFNKCMEEEKSLCNRSPK